MLNCNCNVCLGISQMICLESDDEPENSGMGNWNENEDEVRGLLSSHEPITGNSTRTYDSIGSGSSHGKCLLSF